MIVYIGPQHIFEFHSISYAKLTTAKAKGEIPTTQKGVGRKKKDPLIASEVIFGQPLVSLFFRIHHHFPEEGSG